MGYAKRGREHKYIYLSVCECVSVCVYRKLADVDINASLGGINQKSHVKSLQTQANALNIENTYTPGNSIRVGQLTL